jgi:hypothetical protein
VEGDQARHPVGDLVAEAQPLEHGTRQLGADVGMAQKGNALRGPGRRRRLADVVAQHPKPQHQLVLCREVRLRPLRHHVQRSQRVVEDVVRMEPVLADPRHALDLGQQPRQDAGGVELADRFARTLGEDHAAELLGEALDADHGGQPVQ